jgi:hypothetical protein
MNLCPSVSAKNSESDKKKVFTDENNELDSMDKERFGDCWLALNHGLVLAVVGLRTSTASGTGLECYQPGQTRPHGIDNVAQVHQDDALTSAKLYRLPLILR